MGDLTAGILTLISGTYCCPQGVVSMKGVEMRGKLQMHNGCRYEGGHQLLLPGFLCLWSTSANVTLLSLAPPLTLLWRGDWGWPPFIRVTAPALGKPAFYLPLHLGSAGGSQSGLGCLLYRLRLSLGWVSPGLDWWSTKGRNGASPLARGPKPPSPISFICNKATFWS